MASDYDYLFKLLLIGDSGALSAASTSAVAGAGPHRRVRRAC